MEAKRSLLGPPGSGTVAEIFRWYTVQARRLGHINLSQGIPEDEKRSAFHMALTASLDVGWQYVDPQGLEELRVAVAMGIYEGSFDASQVLVTSGCTESLALAVQCLAGAGWGDRVVLLEPFYPYYRGLVLQADLVPVPVRMTAGRNAGVDVDLVAQHCRQGARILLLNTPHNPTGWVVSREQARSLRRIVDECGVFLIIDDAYRSFIYEHGAEDATDALIRDNPCVLVAGSASKLLSATGLRIGWLAGRGDALDRAYARHVHVTYCQPGPLQKMTAILLGARTPEQQATLVARYRTKRNLLVDGLRGAGVDCSVPSGGHFVMARWDQARAQDGQDLALAFARRYGLMGLPLDAFYGATPEKGLRLSFSGDMATVERAAQSLKAASTGCLS